MVPRASCCPDPQSKGPRPARRPRPRPRGDASAPLGGRGFGNKSESADEGAQKAPGHAHLPDRPPPPGRRRRPRGSGLAFHPVNWNRGFSRCARGPPPGGPASPQGPPGGHRIVSAAFSTSRFLRSSRFAQVPLEPPPPPGSHAVRGRDCPHWPSPQRHAAGECRVLRDLHHGNLCRASRAAPPQSARPSLLCHRARAGAEGAANLIRQRAAHAASNLVSSCFVSVSMVSPQRPSQAGTPGT